MVGQDAGLCGDKPLPGSGAARRQKMMIMSAKAIVAIGGIAYWLCYGMFKIKRGNIEMHEFVLVWVFLILYLTRDLFR